jgi:hypothetical protein
MDMLKGRPGKASTSTRLSDLGISHDQSSTWQKLAGVPEDLFEQALVEPRPSTGGIIERHEAVLRAPVPAVRRLLQCSATWAFRLSEAARAGQDVKRNTQNSRRRGKRSALSRRNSASRPQQGCPQIDRLHVQIFHRTRG